jgi:hypothetical protein
MNFTCVACFSLQSVQNELETATATRVKLEAELARVEVDHKRDIEEHRSRYLQLETEVHSLRTELEGRQAADELAAGLAIELEKEKGRLAGLQKCFCSQELLYCLNHFQ